VTLPAIEERIRQMRDSGELSGLPGEGAPLPVDPDAGAGEAWAARHLVRTSRARPEWVQLRQDVGELRSRIAARVRAHRAWLERRGAQLDRFPAERILLEVAATRAADERVRNELNIAVDEVNARVRQHNLLVPSPTLHLQMVTLEGLLGAGRD
jgi:hypothetical protein